MYTSIWWYLRVLPVLHRPEVVDIGVKSYIEQEISLKKIFGGSQILTINATKFAGLDEGATPLGPYSATRGFTW